ncbi:DUF2283 domain-containing protein [Candidatus Hakubella thermalkaliphila]|uniref:DUF2283 domain-containing protein n=1 Tax=Candidatus Hakubella thermalkaliphila TaxID=2754717 RepID=UPI00387EB825
MSSTFLNEATGNPLKENGLNPVSAFPVTPGVHADFDQDEKLIGIEVIDASEVIGGKIEFELPEVIHASTMRV